MRAQKYPYDYNLKIRYPNRCLVVPYIGGGSVWKAERAGKFYLLIDGGTSDPTPLAKTIIKELLERPMSCEEWELLHQMLNRLLESMKEAITILEFDVELERKAYFQEQWPDCSLRCKTWSDMSCQ